MKVVLLQSVKSLGEKGDVVEVSEGYAMNFLFPQHMAVEATARVLKNMADRERSAKKKEKKEEREERQLASEIDGQEIIIKVKADGGKLYAAIKPNDVQKALKEMDIQVKKELIKLPTIKETGSYEASVEFKTGFEATVNIIVEEA